MATHVHSLTRSTPVMSGAVGGRPYAELERSFRGELIRPGSPGYEEHRRVWNGSIDRYPALIARCSSVSDVVAAVRFARATGIPAAVRSGGHSFAGLSTCDDGIVIALRPMNRIVVDPERRAVRAEAGVLLGELDAATQPFGMAVPTGSVTHTGLAGLTLGGGIGWLMRKLGLTVDQLQSVELVDADGRLLTASATENADLFWGLRGGGGNFGIATGFEFRLHPVGPTILSGLLLWPLDEAPTVVRAYREWAHGAPDELTSALVLRRAPAIGLIPERLHGQPVVGVACCWAGPIDHGVAVLEPMRRIGARAVDLTAPRPFVEQQSIFDASFPPGLWGYSKAADVHDLTDGVVDVLLAAAVRVTSTRSTITAWQLGGAVSRVDDRDTAFGSRSSGWVIDMFGAAESETGFEDERQWARESWSSLAPHGSGVYVNWLMEEGAERVRESYGASRYARLQALKRRYDPDNFFRLNQNIRPA